MKRLDFYVVFKLFFLSLLLDFSIFLTQNTIPYSGLFKPVDLLTKVQGKVKLETVALADAIHIYYMSGGMFLDVRAKQHYEYGHIQGAINLPSDEIENLSAELIVKLQRSPMVIIYCGSSSCSLSYSIARKLMKRGVNNIGVYMGGWDEWYSCRLPIAMSVRMKSDVGLGKKHEK